MINSKDLTLSPCYSDPQSLLLIIIFNFILIICHGEELQPNKKVVLTGKLETKTYFDANNKPEEEYVLILNKHIDVVEDKGFGGPEKNVSEIQLIVYSDDQDKANKLINKNVEVTGSLFHGHTAHHHTKILLAVDSLKGVAPK